MGSGSYHDKLTACCWARPPRPYSWCEYAATRKPGLRTGLYFSHSRRQPKRGRVICGGKAHAFAALRAENAGKGKTASHWANPYRFSIDLLSRLSRRRPCLRVDGTMQPRGADYPASLYRVATDCLRLRVPRVFRQSARSPATCTFPARALADDFSVSVIPSSIPDDPALSIGSKSGSRRSPSAGRSRISRSSYRRKAR